MDYDKFKELLLEQVAFPDYYQFKFVVKSEKKQEVLDLLKDQQVTEKLSKKGTYTSITSRKIFNNPDEIIDVYKKVTKIEGILSL